ncbi:GGDEF domain-containing protein [Aneurinibacillus tyrosinisolvens]|uniref:GGDEF domain-containing protein n=1 Tax=Aneurinibacillus tyrosinisolvens TaxID=1443435 RepID=UPI00063FBD2D|nr:GGDEF domain-containing protein [Aneurinibacillus tyrosinisolvens]
MKYTGRVVVFLLVFVINSSYIAYYYMVDGHVEIIEKVGLPIMLCLAWFFGRQYDQAKFLSDRDVLTKAYNRRFIYKTFSKLQSKVNRMKDKLTVFVVDIDKFKCINDTYGHEIGDEVLQQISNALLSSVRKIDIVSRWGGDEFLIIVPCTDKIGIEIVIHDIEKDLQKLSRHLKADISVSIGTAIYPNDAKTLDDLVRIADRNMYHFKARKAGNQQKM